MSVNEVTISGVSEREQLFVEEYLVDFDAARAAKEAGYRSYNSDSRKLLSKPSVQAYIESRIDIRGKVHQIDSYYLIDKFKQVLDADFLEWDGDIQSMPSEMRKMVTSYEVSTNRSGERTYKLKFMNKDKALELLGKYLGIFVDKTETNLKFGNLADEIAKARRRLDERGS